MDLRLAKGTELGTVAVRARRSAAQVLEDLDRRDREGFGFRLRGDEIAWYPDTRAVIAQFPSLEVRGRWGYDMQLTFPSARGGRCTAIVYIDGFKMSVDALRSYKPNDFIAIEVYPHEFSVPQSVVRSRPTCGVILAWTKFLR